jgi:preprotein translocase subunit SecF
VRFPRRPYFNIVGNWKIWYAISVVIFIVALVALFTRGLNFGIDFTGGTEVTIKTKSSTPISKIRGVTGKFGYAGAQIQVSGSNTYIIRVPELNDQKKSELVSALDEDVGLQKDAEGKAIVDIKAVGPGWGAQVSRQAIIALAVFIVAILIYISFRFEFKMAIVSIIEILHDFVITIGIYALTGREVTPATVIAVLTILGYSLYDAIVIFDRVKENADQLTRQSKMTYSETVNDSVNQVLVRSINTSLTTLIPIVAILLFGGETLTAFAFPLFIGVLSGTYSSIILAPPILAQWKETEPKYRAYRERVAKGTVKGVAPKPEKGAVGTARKTEGAKPRPAQPKKKAAGGAKAAGAPKAKPAVTPKPPAAKQDDTKAAEAGTAAAKPKPKPKAPPGKAAQQTSKSLAKSRTKGPGSGKKKKKKK